MERVTRSRAHAAAAGTAQHHEQEPNESPRGSTSSKQPVSLVTRSVASTCNVRTAVEGHGREKRADVMMSPGASPRSVRSVPREKSAALLRRRNELMFQLKKIELEQQLAEVDELLANDGEDEDAYVLPLCDEPIDEERNEDSQRLRRGEWPHHTESGVDVSFPVGRRGATDSVAQADASRLAAVDQNDKSYADNKKVACATAGDLSEVDKFVRAINNLALSSSIGSGNNNLSFSGKPGEWLLFKAAFKEAGDRSKFSKLEEVARLRKMIKGEALEAVSALLVGCADPDEILDALERRFANPDQIVAEQVNIIRSLPRLSNFGKDLCTFASKIHNALATLRLLHRPEYILSPELQHSVLSKMTPLLRSLYVNFAAEDTSGHPPMELLSRFLNREADRQMKFGGAVYQSVSTNSETSRAMSSGNRAKVCTTVSSSKLCACKNGEHDLLHCTKFASMSVDDRWQWTKENHFCFKCLKGKHRQFVCKAKPCGVGGCLKRHHELLHKPEVVNVITPAPNMTPPSSKCDQAGEGRPAVNVSVSPIKTEPVTAASTPDDDTPLHRRVLLQMAPITIYGPIGSIDTFALLDQGSTATLIDASVASSLGLEGPSEPLFIDAIGGLQIKGVKSQYVNFDIKGKFCDDVYRINGARALNNLSLSGQTINRDVLRNCEHLADIEHLLCYDSAVPAVLLGQDQWPLIVSSEIRRGKPSQPVASRTVLGWVAHGTSHSTAQPVHYSSHHVSTKLCSCDVELEALIKSQYAIDAIGVTKKELRSTADERALTILKKTISKLPEGRFEVGLLWREDDFKFPPSYSLAMSRLRSTERKMDKDPAYAARYTAQINDMLAKGYAVKCVDSTIESDSGRRWYLPHFGVINPNKPNKLRIVHDAAAQVQGVSLNSALLIGPDLIQPLLGILLRFREGKYALTADIKEMFPQVKIKQSDREAQRFLWRGEDRERAPDQYEMSSMIFGAASSPCSAIYVKNFNAEQHADQYPEAARVIIEDHYVDDCITSLDDELLATKLAADVTTVHQLAGYEIRAWASNSLLALSDVPEDRRDPTMVQLNHHGNASQRILGLLWSPTNDTLSFTLNLSRLPPEVSTGKKPPTKRQLLSIVMSIFDPIGLLGPIVIQGRMLFQDAWRSQITWEERLKPKEEEKWVHWLPQLFNVAHINVPRWYQTDLAPVRRELHTFCDAGENAYGTICYWRFIYEDGHIRVALVASKSRVAPLKAVSIPRLELQAALLGSRLATYVAREQRRKADEFYFWTDSRTVLSWLRSDHRNYKPYVAHRVAEILDLTSVERWRWLPSNENVADLLTKVNAAECFSSDGVWFNGPEFIHRSENTWRKEPPTPEAGAVADELRVTVTQVQDSSVSLPVTPDVNRFSRWMKYVRSTAIVVKFCRLLLESRDHSLGIGQTSTRVPNQRYSPPAQILSTEDLRAAEIVIWRRVQAQHFSAEVGNLLKAGPIPKYSKLKKLNLFIDADNLLRLGGRIDNVENVDTVTRPLVLPGKDRAVRLVVQYYHERYGHANNETVVNHCRQVYWIIGLRNVVRTVARDCLQCKIRRATPVVPPEGALPTERLAHHRRPFTHVGLDYFGPVLVCVGRRQEKRWVALFACLTTRAVTLDMVSSLSTDAAIMALRRFIARRGCPATISSDNSSAFRGADVESKRTRNEADAAMRVFATNNNITWKFTPPAAPSIGESWQRLNQSVKRTLKITLKERVPRVETLATFLAEAEHIINARPLTYVSSEADDFEALTPLHFILGSAPGIQSTFGVTNDDDFILRKEWRKAQRLADHFWARWVKEYLPSLRPPHYSGTGTEFKEGDLVLVADPALPRNTWPLGRITQLYPGRDGVTRVVDVLTRGITLKRPVTKIAPLPVHRREGGSSPAPDQHLFILDQHLS